jgi:RNase P/RNase MRP subunit POP5
MKQQKKSKTITPPTLREKKRYLLIEIMNAQIPEKDFYFGFWIELLSFFGSKGIGEMNPRIVAYGNNKAILKCNRGAEINLMAGIAFIKEIRNKKVILNPLLVSGSIKNLLEAGKFEKGKKVFNKSEAPKQKSSEKVEKTQTLAK